jgi:small subunit ribosomal protein S2
LPTVLVKELIESGVHFGHRASRWNPKMRPYIYARRNLIHIIDVRETIRGLLRARRYLQRVVAGGSLVLFVGTKRQACDTIEQQAKRAGMPYVSERWLGGTLTNFRTIRSRLTRLEQLESMRATDEISAYSKKMQSALNREYRKMFRNLNGMRTMNRLPEALIVVDPRKERNAIREAQKLGITTIALIDTDCDPDEVDLPIPGNDDSIRSIELVMRLLADAVLAGKAASGQMKEEMPAPAAAEPDPAAEAPAETPGEAPAEAPAEVAADAAGEPTS